MYVGVLTVVVGWVMFFGTAALLIYLLSVWLAFHLYVVGPSGYFVGRFWPSLGASPPAPKPLAPPRKGLPSPQVG